MKYVERSGQTELHSVEYGYNSENNLSAVTETVNGATHKTEYDYDSENRLTETDYGNRIEKITYDDFVKAAANHKSSVKLSDIQKLLKYAAERDIELPDEM